MQRRANDLARPGFSGFGLVAILVVLLIVLLLYTTSGPSGKNALQAAQESKEEGEQLAARINEDQISLLVTQYKLEHGRLPATLADLGLERRPEYTDEFGNLMYLREGDRAPGGRQTLEIVSPGADGEPDTDDDTVFQTIRVQA